MTENNKITILKEISAFVAELSSKGIKSINELDGHREELITGDMGQDIKLLANMARILSFQQAFVPTLCMHRDMEKVSYVLHDDKFDAFKENTIQNLEIFHKANFANVTIMEDDANYTALAVHYTMPFFEIDFKFNMELSRASATTPSIE